MRLKEFYYAYNKKHISFRNAVVLVIIVFFLINVFYTLGRYSNTVFGSCSINIAKWLVAINGEQISSNTSVLSSTTQLINSSDGTTGIDVGDECYFDINLNQLLV